jgi:hypothetical protein
MCEAAHAFFFVRAPFHARVGQPIDDPYGRKKSRHLSQMAGLIE